MSTVIELSEEMASSLDRRGEREHISREEVIRRALAAYLALERPAGDREELVGSWKGIDGLEYQQRIRAEWER